MTLLFKYPGSIRESAKRTYDHSYISQYYTVIVHCLFIQVLFINHFHHLAFLVAPPCPLLRVTLPPLALVTFRFLLAFFDPRGFPRFFFDTSVGVSVSGCGSSEDLGDSKSF